MAESEESESRGHMVGVTVRIPSCWGVAYTAQKRHNHRCLEKYENAIMTMWNSVPGEFLFISYSSSLAPAMSPANCIQLPWAREIVGRG